MLLKQEDWGQCILELSHCIVNPTSNEEWQFCKYMQDTACSKPYFITEEVLQINVQLTLS